MKTLLFLLFSLKELHAAIICGQTGCGKTAFALDLLEADVILSSYSYCDHIQHLMDQVLQCFPKEFMSFQNKGLSLSSLLDLDTVLQRLEEDGGYKLFNTNFTAIEKGCKSNSVENVMSCFTNTMASCNITVTKNDQQSIVSRYKLMCDNIDYLQQHECCIQQSYVYQTPCYTSELKKLKSELDDGKEGKCSHQTCILNCMQQAQEMAHCEEKLRGLLFRLNEPVQQAQCIDTSNKTTNCSAPLLLQPDLGCL